MGDKEKKAPVMAGRKGKEIALQQEIETQEEWEDMLSKEGLCVVDLYQGWCGLCTGMVSNWRQYRNNFKDEKLTFFAAKVDTVDALENYRGRCEPCFLFYAGGVLVAVVRGANAPLILRTITEQLAQEHKVLDGQAERKEIKDTLIAQSDVRDREEDDEEEMEDHRMNFQGEIIDFGDDLENSGQEPVKEVSVVIIKPDAVQSGKAGDIIAEMKKRGIEILRQEERQLTKDEAANVYTHLQDETYFDDLITFMTSAPCIVMAITKGKTGANIIKEFRELIGPREVEEAKEQAPDSLRAKFGQEKYMNAVHGSDSSDTAARELAFFFPDFVAPRIEGKPKLQRTLALIRPDAYREHKDEIIAKIREAGFKIAMSREVRLSKDQAEDFYSEHAGQEYFDELTTRMSSGPLLALGLAREEAIKGWRDMLGPKVVSEAKEKQPGSSDAHKTESLRAQFAVEGAQINMLHGSSTEEEAKKEIEYFFPVEQTVAVIKPDAIGTKDEIIEKIHEAGFRIAARKETTLSREIAEEFYADHKDKPYYEQLVQHMSSGPTYFMVLSREGAVDGWRSMIGPKDPQEAKNVDPDTLRGQFGTDVLKNAVHGSSNPEHAKQTISRIFGELSFSRDGSVSDKQEAIMVQRQDLSEVAPEYDRGPQKRAKSPKVEAKAEEPPKKEETPPKEQPAEEKRPVEEPPAQQQEPEKPAEEKAPEPPKPETTPEEPKAEEREQKQESEEHTAVDSAPAEPKAESEALKEEEKKEETGESKPEEPAEGGQS
ncbi:thioredoxin domain-containing protein 6-like isoform X18 [Dreissena polymorpha]|uniref:thioredoxin domain-containing protein 6-like isoform X17 n=1 Tax=Dreissena polymorpha TaxID=45954 RepID=UPI002263EAAD|nr:thioredoxin domain-containing protein 6-like isoform X17 [Dreissena polymorpha]XP_052234801.1 thioredoxin domain-containing protein 6-like isoform X18 [Dreissena polymorpha]